MLTGHNIVYFGPGKWNGMWRNRHQLMSRFARHNKVLYVEPVVYLKKVRHLLRQRRSGWNEFWQAAKQKRITKAAENLYIYHSPAYIPISGRFPLDKITWWSWNLRFEQTLRTLCFSRPIIWLSQPQMTHFVGNYNETLTIYHVVDEYLAYGDINLERRARLQSAEHQILKKVDLVIVVSKKLFKTKGIFNKNTYVVPNGMDYASYDLALLSNEPLPADVARLPKPIIGYSGLISARLDLNLLRYIASTNPEWSFVLIGVIDNRGCKRELGRLRELNNVHFLGLKEIKQVPYYIKAFDVGIIPYMINEETENLSPLKLYDFMAAGKPIVTTNFPAAQEVKDLIYIADRKETFTRRIDVALREKDDSLYVKRRCTASQNTWDHRVSQLSRLIESRLTDRSVT